MSGERPLLSIEEVAERYCTSVGAIHNRTSRRAMPMLKRAGFRRLLFPRVDLDAWDAGAELECVELPGGGIRVRARSEGNGARPPQDLGRSS